MVWSMRISQVILTTTCKHVNLNCASRLTAVYSIDTK